MYLKIRAINEKWIIDNEKLQLNIHWNLSNSFELQIWTDAAYIYLLIQWYLKDNEIDKGVNSIIWSICKIVHTHTNNIQHIRQNLLSQSTFPLELILFERDL